MRNSRHPPYTYLGALFQIFCIKNLGSKWMRGAWSSLFLLSPLLLLSPHVSPVLSPFSPSFHFPHFFSPYLFLFHHHSLFSFLLSSSFSLPTFPSLFPPLLPPPLRSGMGLESKTTAEPSRQSGTIQLHEKYKRKIVWPGNQGQNLFE